MNDDITLGRILEKLEEMDQKQDGFGTRIDHLEDNLKAAVWVFRTIKYLGLGVMALLTFNFTNLIAILEKFKNG